MRRLIFLLLLLTACPSLATAQNAGPLPAMEWKDVSAWRYIPGNGVKLSDNGTWAAYSLVAAEDNAEIILKSLKDDTIRNFKAGGSTSPVFMFSEDGKWFAYKEYPKYKKAAAKKNNAGSEASNSEKVFLVNLANLESTEIENAASFGFNGETASYLAVELQDKKDSGNSAKTILLHHLDSGKKIQLTNVEDYAFNKKGTLLAYTTDNKNGQGNGLYLFKPAAGSISVLDNDTASYKALNWTKDKDALTVIKTTKDNRYENEKGVLLGAKNLTGKAVMVSFDPAETDLKETDKMTASAHRKAYWSDDLKRIIFGVNELKEAKKSDSAASTPDNDAALSEAVRKLKADDSIKTLEDLKKALADIEKKKKEQTGNDAVKPDVVIWNWQDSRLQSMQQVQENADKKYSYTAVYNTDTKSWFMANDSSMKQVQVLPKENYAIGTAEEHYLLQRSLDGRNYADLYIINLTDGSKTLFREKLYMPSFASRPVPSPDGKKILFGFDGHYYVRNLENGDEINLTAGVPSSFINTEDDHNTDKPLTGSIGWSSDSRYVLLRDLWDVWQIKVDKKPAAVNLTRNGASDKIRYQRHFNIYPEDEGIDLSKNQYFRMYGEWNKKSGIAQITGSKNGLKPGVNVLKWDDVSYNNLGKTKHADIYYYSQETFNTAPEYYYGNHSLNSTQQITQNTPDKDRFAFSAGTRLVDYVSDKGDSLQGVIYLPANYREGEKYPAIVYYYEKTSQMRHSYTNPAFSRTGYNPQIFTSQGYAVFTPDIVYKMDDPGRSALWAVLPGVKAAIETGIIDPDKMGLQGHSWGGYQTAFLVTQTDMFKAAAPGAALTDMTSMYSLIYWNTGSGNMSIFEASQGRFRQAPWENWEIYNRNSPLYYVKQVKTPILMLHNDKDGAVDFTQGIEFYSALRRLHKPIVMMQYKGENHGLAKMENQKDYGVRMLEFFDHFLKNKTAPSWWENGVDYLKLDEHLEKRAF